jgi:hypothetical protein
MKTLYHKLFIYFNRYKKVNKRMHGVVTTKDSVRSVIFSLVMSIIILVIPLLIVINMFIYTKLTLFLAICIVFIVLGFIYLYYWFYFQLLKNYQPKIEDINTSYIYWFETSLINLFLIIFAIIILSVLF